MSRGKNGKALSQKWRYWSSESMFNKSLL